MKPTRNQLLAACGQALDIDKLNVSDALVQVLRSASPSERHEIVKELTSYSELHLTCEIKPRSEAEQSMWDELQVPIEPFVSYWQCAIALAWCCNESRACVLVPKEGQANLLVQAVRAQLHINRFEVKQVYDKSTKLTKEVQFLDRGSVLLAFELAGLPAPKSYDDWRLPDGDNVPLMAVARWLPEMGTMTVHYTNGMSALVTSGDGMRAKLVEVKHLKSAAANLVNGLSNRAKGATVRESKEKLTQDEAKSLASKFCKRMTSKEVAA